MATTLLIEKETGGYYGFTLTIDAVVQDKVRNMRNDAFAIGNVVNFKTANGANIIKKQNISIFDITLIASGTFTFTNIDTFLAKLVDVGYFDWFLATGGGGGVDRFDELLDTFSYFGKDGQCVIVDEDQLKLVTVPLYNYRNITDLEDTFDAHIEDKMLVSKGGMVILQDIPSIPTPYLSSIGVYTYGDSATAITPLTVLATVEKKLTNDSLGDSTYYNAPYGIGTIWNPSTNQFDFSYFNFGDIITLRIDSEITTTAINQNNKVYIKLGIGSPSEKIRIIGQEHVKSVGAFEFDEETNIIFSNQDFIDFPAEICILSENDATVVVNEFEIIVIQKSVNIIDIDSDIFPYANLATFPVTGEVGKFYYAIDTDLYYKWDGATYEEFGTGEDATKLAILNNLSDLDDVPTAIINLGLENVDNTSDANKPVSTATQTALDLKAPLASPTFTGSVVVPNGSLSTEAVNKGQLDAVSANSSLVPLDEGNGIGHVINGRTAANYGNVGLDAVDLSTSTSASTTRGGTGRSSFTSGENNTNSGRSALVTGSNNNNSGIYGFLVGDTNTGSGTRPVGFGSNNTISNQDAFVIGGYNTGNATMCFIQGLGNATPSYEEAIFGQWSTSVTPSSTTAFNSADRALTVGNGTGSGTRSNSFVILKNGLATLPSVTNALINASGTGKEVATTEWVSAKTQNITFVYLKSDLPTPSAGIITLADNTTYFITGTVDLTGDRLVGGVNTTIIGGSSENCRIKSTGLVTALITSVYSLPIRNITIEASLALDLDGDGTTTALDWFGVNFTDCAVIGTVKDYTNFIMTDCAFLNSGGMTLDGTIGSVGFSTCLFDCNTTNTAFILPATLTITRRFRIIYSSFVVLSGETGINVNASATIPSEAYILDTVNFSGGGTYLTGLTHTSNDSLFINCTNITNTSVNGQLYMQGNVTATTVSATNTFYKVLGTTTASADNSRFTHSNNRLTCDAVISRKYLIQANLSFTAGNNNVCEFGFYDSTLATIRTPSKTKATANGSGRAENVSFACVVTMVANDYIEIHCANTSAITDITIDQLNFIITEIK